MHLMIDLETLSTAPTAVITQLGYAFFDPYGDGVTKSGVYHLEVPPQVERGLVVDWKTISWWLVQNEEARQKLVNPNRHLPSDAISLFDAVCLEQRIDGVWSHGATFDLVILANLYRAARRREPWEFRAARDTRTLFWLAGDKLVWPDNPVKHSAEHDAIAQAITVQRAIRLLKPQPKVEEEKTCTSSPLETSTTPSNSESSISESGASVETPATDQSL